MNAEVAVCSWVDRGLPANRGNGSGAEALREKYYAEIRLAVCVASFRLSCRAVPRLENHG